MAHPERVAAAVEAVGVRSTIGRWGWDIEHGPFTAPAAEVIANAAELLDRFPPDGDGLVQGWVTLVGHDLMSDALIDGATALARDRGARHDLPPLAERLRPAHRTSPAPGGARWCTWPTSECSGRTCCWPTPCTSTTSEVDLLLAHDVAVASCPWAYLRLGQGFGRASRHLELAVRGGRVALGCDAENAGDQIDVLRAAALFAGMAKDGPPDPTVAGRPPRAGAGDHPRGRGDRTGRRARLDRGRKAGRPGRVRHPPAGVGARRRRPGAAARVGHRRARRSATSWWRARSSSATATRPGSTRPPWPRPSSTPVGRCAARRCPRRQPLAPPPPLTATCLARWRSVAAASGPTGSIRGVVHGSGVWITAQIASAIRRRRRRRHSTEARSAWVLSSVVASSGKVP